MVDSMYILKHLHIIMLWSTSADHVTPSLNNFHQLPPLHFKPTKVNLRVRIAFVSSFDFHKHRKFQVSEN